MPAYAYFSWHFALFFKNWQTIITFVEGFSVFLRHEFKIKFKINIANNFYVDHTFLWNIIVPRTKFEKDF